MFSNDWPMFRATLGIVCFRTPAMSLMSHRSTAIFTASEMLHCSRTVSRGRGAPGHEGTCAICSRSVPDFPGITAPPGRAHATRGARKAVLLSCVVNSSVRVAANDYTML
jgi:hypothetical protein